MFRLAKILNTGVGYAEPITVTAEEGRTFKYGALFTITNGVIKSASALTRPTHICGKNVKIGKDRRVTFYPIGENMVFSAPIDVEPEGMGVGTRLTLGVDGESFALSLGAEAENGPATVHDMAGATKIGDTIYVIFK